MNAITLSALAAFPQQLEDHHVAIPAEYRQWAPSSWEGVPSGCLTAIEQVCHARDIEVEGYHVRFQRTLQEFNPTLATIDSEALAVTRSYATSNMRSIGWLSLGTRRDRPTHLGIESGTVDAHCRV